MKWKIKIEDYFIPIKNPNFMVQVLFFNI